MNRVFIVGAIGFGKMAEECILIQMIHDMRKEHPGVHIGVLSNEPGKTAKLGVEAVPRQDMKAMREAVEDSDTVVWLRSEHQHDWRSLGLEAFLVRLAKWRKKKTLGYRTQSARKPSGWVGNQAERVFGQCDRKIHFTLEESHSPEETAEQETVNRTLSPHPLLSVKRSKLDGLRHLQDEGIYLSQRPIALCLERETALACSDQAASLADTLIDGGATLLFMPTDHFADMEAANQVLDRMSHSAAVMRKTYSAQEWIDILGDTQIVLTTYDSVQAMCRGLDVPCVRLNEKTLASVEVESLLAELEYVSSKKYIYRQK